MHKIEQICIFISWDLEKGSNDLDKIFYYEGFRAEISISVKTRFPSSPEFSEQSSVTYTY